MSIRKIVAEKINDLREKIAIWDSPSASSEAKGNALASLVGNDPRFWGVIAKLATNKKPMVETADPAVIPVSTVIMSKPIPTEKFAKLSPASTRPVPATAPARTLQPPAKPEETPEQRRDKFFSILTGFIAGKRIDFEKTRNFMVSVFRSGVELTKENWKTLFAAMKRAATIGHYLIDSGSATKFFAAAPAELIDDYVFGQDGAMTLAMADLRDSEGNSMPAWLIAKVWVLVAALVAIEDNMDEFAESRVEKLLNAVKEADGPGRLIEEIQALLPTETEELDFELPTESVGNGGARIIGGEESLRAVAAAVEFRKAEFISALQ